MLVPVTVKLNLKMPKIYISIHTLDFFFYNFYFAAINDCFYYTLFL